MVRLPTETVNAGNWERHTVELLRSQDHEVVLAARARLLKSGQAQPLLEGLRHPEWRVRAHCLKLLSELVVNSDLYEELDGRIRSALRDPDSGVRREAIHALVRRKRNGHTWDGEVVTLLLHLLQHDPIPRVRRVAVGALGVQPRHPAIEESIRPLLAGETDTRLLYNARWAFDIEERRQFAAARSRAARRAAGSARRAALRQSLQLDSSSSEDLVERLALGDERSALACEILFDRGKEAMETILAGLSHPDARVRASCSGLMDHLGDTRCVLPLTRAIQDADVHVRRAALHSLSCRPCKEAPLEGDLVGPIIDRALHDRNRRIRHVATLALASMEYDPRAVHTLQQILESTSDGVLRSRARAALERQKAQNPHTAGP